MAKKKSYNPFKMWGSYIGSIIGLIPFLGSKQQCIALIVDSSIPRDPTNFMFQCTLSPMLISFILNVGLGFLLGWGIHSLIRIFRK
ncbi:MAG: hypothetical protein AABY22_03810 [Nanoarchaeota archaeon]